MFNVFEQPWTLLTTAIIVQLLIMVVRIIYSAERKWRHFLPALLIIISAFSLDLLVKTDLEKINAILDTCQQGIEQEDAQKIAEFISPNYRDSAHSSKAMLVAVCQSLLSGPLVEKFTQTKKEIQILPATEKADQATAMLSGLIILDKESSYGQQKSFVLLKGRLYFEKTATKKWLINRVELLEIDHYKLGWKDVGF